MANVRLVVAEAHKVDGHMRQYLRPSRIKRKSTNQHHTRQMHSSVHMCEKMGWHRDMEASDIRRKCRHSAEVSMPPPYLDHSGAAVERGQRVGSEEVPREHRDRIAVAGQPQLVHHLVMKRSKIIL